jgi:hypothetical protein
MDSPMVEEKGRKFRIRVRPTRWNYIGVFLSMVGFILIFLCLVGGFTTSSKGIYFAKIKGSNVTATFGLLGYCTEQASQVTCHQDDAVKLMPFSKSFLVFFFCFLFCVCVCVCVVVVVVVVVY